jgi:hypothetical protein
VVLRTGWMHVHYHLYTICKCSEAAVLLLRHIDVRDSAFYIDPRQVTNVCELGCHAEGKSYVMLGPHLEPLQ